MVKHKPRSLDATFAALADPIRRSILEHLAHGEASVGDLAAPFKVSPPAISRHLRVLEHAGLLARRKVGRVHRCRLRPHPMTDAAEWIEHCREYWERQFDQLAQYLEQSEKKEKAQWQHPAPVPKQRSKSQGPSRRPGKKSSRRGPNRNE